MKNIHWDGDNLRVEGNNYTLQYCSSEPLYVNLMFDNEVGAKLFIPSGCDCDDKIDEVKMLGKPVVEENSEGVMVCFTGQTTLWEKVEYVFSCRADRVVYSYRLFGQGKLDDVRYFEGFVENDVRMDQAFYPYFCGPGRHLAYHRPAKEFMQSSKPGFETVYSFEINSADKRRFMYYEDIDIRVNGDRHYLGGDWLATPAPFLYLLGNKKQTGWVTMGLVVKPGEAQFMSYEYLGGEGFGLKLDYDGMTEVSGQWQSPEIVFMAGGKNEYTALEVYVSHVEDSQAMPKKDRSETPMWWKRPIFGGWGEQVYHSNRWDMYFGGKHDDWKDDNVDKLCTQSAYEEMLSTLESKGIDPTILIIDNRWFSLESHLKIDTELWPDMKDFIRKQHAKGRKVILWVSPWSYCRSAWGQDVPLDEHLMLDEAKFYTLEIDTDVFYPACKRNKEKVRKQLVLPPATLTEPNWRLFVDPLNENYAKRITEKIHYLLSPDGLDADGLEFDYTHFLPQHRGIMPVTPHVDSAWGIELLHRLLSIYYMSAKSAKADALIISHTFNPYFNDVVDMLRMQDIYTDRKSIVSQMEHRSKIAKAVCPGCVIHTDQHPMPSLEAWREYMKFQPTLGNPCLYYVTGIETTREKFTEEDFTMLREVWGKYNQDLEKKAEN